MKRISTTALLLACAAIPAASEAAYQVEPAAPAPTAVSRASGDLAPGVAVSETTELPAMPSTEQRPFYDAHGRRDPFDPALSMDTREGREGYQDWRQLSLVGLLDAEGREPLAIFFDQQAETGRFYGEGQQFRVGELHEVSPQSDRVVVREPRGDNPVNPWADYDILLHPNEQGQ